MILRYILAMTLSGRKSSKRSLSNRALSKLHDSKRQSRLTQPIFQVHRPHSKFDQRQQIHQDFSKYYKLKEEEKNEKNFLICKKKKKTKKSKQTIYF